MSISYVRVLAWCVLFVAALPVANHAQAPGPPTGLSSQVAGSFVTISWNAAPGAVSYVVSVGSSPGASDLFNGSVGNAVSASGTVGPGTYYWRVVAMGASGAMSVPSAEAQFTVGGGAGVGGCVPPGAPQAFSATAAGSRVTLRWSPPGGGGAPATYLIEAGSSTGLANLYNAPTGNTATELIVEAVPSGTFYIRVRAQNACGVSGPSNESILQVGGSTSGGSCSYALSPGTTTVPPAGGVVQIDVSTGSGCRWQLSSDSWIVPASNPAGSGPATVGYVVMSNAGSARTGRIMFDTIDPGPVLQQTTISQLAAATTMPPPPPTAPLVARFTVDSEPCPIVNRDPVSNQTVSPFANCTFDASSSTSSVQIISYEWSGVFNKTGPVLPAGSIVFDSGLGGGSFQRSLTLTVRDALGRVNMVTRDVTFRNDTGR